MEVKPGYKQTEVGVIPEEWRVKRLGELADIETGLSKPKIVFGSGCPVVMVQNLYDASTINFAGLRRVVATEDEIRKYRLERGDVLIGNASVQRDGIGYANKFDGAPEDVIFAKYLYRASNLRDVRPSFLLQYLRSAFCRNWIVSNSQTGTLTNLNNTVAAAIPIALPPTKAEQEAIEEALEDVDALLGALEQIIAKKRDLKQAAMQQLLTGQTRLPGFAPANPQFRQSQVGMIPKDWQLAQLVDLVDPSRGIRYGIVQPGDYDPQGRYMIRGQDYSEAKGWAKPSEVFRVSERVEDRYRNARVKEGDLIMTIVGYCGHIEMIPKWLDGANLTQTTARIAIQSDKAVSAYCKYMLQSQTGRNQVAAYMKGAAQPGLNCGDVERFLVILPSISEQAAIAGVLLDMDAEIATLEERLAKTRALKQGMMQELLTGRIRLV